MHAGTASLAVPCAYRAVQACIGLELSDQHPLSDNAPAC